MKLEGNFELATFLRRPNRYLAYVKLEKSGEEVACHVPDPGRLKELLIPKSQVIVRHERGGKRKTKFTLTGVKTRKIWVNIESAFTNTIFKNEYRNIPSLKEYEIIRSEYTFGKSRIDFLMKNKKTNKEVLLEVKGATLVEDDHAFFPDAPTKRGTKHVKELQEAVTKGLEAFIVFIVKREDAKIFSPHKIIDPKFTLQLKKARDKGVKVLAVSCTYNPFEKKEIEIIKEIPVDI